MSFVSCMKNFVRQTINLKYAEKDEDVKGLMSHPKSGDAHAMELEQEKM